MFKAFFRYLAFIWVIKIADKPFRFMYDDFNKNNCHVQCLIFEYLFNPWLLETDPGYH